ncbi:alpha/beta hydrolase [Sphingomonas sp. Root710]|uniref:alpha/beta hydrolase n=1 Tax=Sphingomonas sp. Root710 TaxID=1736594 RepID=UPI0006FFF278|nr:alpha/beta hydrolase [Sphingomonas sp. Root710]KRB85544.1 alpha/beta hydrolase [Sphingomonas sp. Root710]
MALSFDPDVAAAAAPILAAHEGHVPPPAGDWQSRRTGFEMMLGEMAKALPEYPEVARQDFHATAADGSDILLRWYTKDGHQPGSAIFYIHGGGMIMGSVELFDRLVARYVAHTNVRFLAVDYRLAPENPHPTPIEDAFSGLKWLKDHASELNVDPARIGVMGDSAGAGLAAALALLNRDRGCVDLAAQILVQPMLDDRTVEPDPEIAGLALWGYADNSTGWGALLGDAAGGPDVSPYAAPARATDLAGLPPAYLEVGELDIFRDEVLAYARGLTAAGVSTELHLHRGSPHGFDVLAPDAPVSRRAIADRFRAITSV